MARPSKKGVDFFPHDTNCSEGMTLTVLEERWGNDGYAVWFKTLEMIGKSEGLYLDLTSDTRIEFVAAKMHISPITLMDIYTMLAKLKAIDSELFECGIIWSGLFKERLADAYTRRDAPERPKVIPALLQENGGLLQENGGLLQENGGLLQESPALIPENTTLMQEREREREREREKEREKEKEKEPQKNAAQTVLDLGDEPCGKAQKSSKQRPPDEYCDLVTGYIFSKELSDSILEWLHYKSERKDKYTEIGFKKLLGQIEKRVKQYGEELVIDLIDDCMANGWQGIIWDRLAVARASPKSRHSAFYDVTVKHMEEESGNEQVRNRKNNDVSAGRLSKLT